MLCHECGIAGVERTAVGLCRFCLVGLCKEHLVDAYHPALFPQYACSHHPGRPRRAASEPAAARLAA